MKVCVQYAHAYIPVTHIISSYFGKKHTAHTLQLIRCGDSRYKPFTTLIASTCGECASVASRDESHTRTI